MTLIADTTTLKKYISGFNKETNFATVASWVGKAERTYLIPKIGRPLYQALLSGPGADPMPELRTMCEAVVAWYAYYLALPHLDVTPGDLGLKLNTSANTTQLPKWKYVEILRTTADTADDEMEALLAFLFENADDIPGWKSSTAFADSRALLFRSGAELSKTLPVAGGRYRTYLALQPYLARAESALLPLCTPAVISELKLKWVADAALTEAETELLRLAREYVAPHAMLDALPDVKFRLFPDGLKVSTYEDAFAQQPTSSQERVFADTEAKLQIAAKAAEAELVAFLRDTSTATVFPTFYHKFLNVYKPDRLFESNGGNNSFAL